MARDTIGRPSTCVAQLSAILGSIERFTRRDVVTRLRTAGLSEERHYLKCTGRKPDGGSCNETLAARVAGTFVFKVHGLELVAVRVRSVLCPHCGNQVTITDAPMLAPVLRIQDE